MYITGMETLLNDEWAETAKENLLEQSLIFSDCIVKITNYITNLIIMPTPAYHVTCLTLNNVCSE